MNRQYQSSPSVYSFIVRAAAFILLLDSSSLWNVFLLIRLRLLYRTVKVLVHGRNKAEEKANTDTEHLVVCERFLENRDVK